jgi:GntR family transcriptional regulator
VTKRVLDTNSSKPLYEQIKEFILHQIHAGYFVPNTRIPSERDLSKKFGVSRLTVNRAIKELVQEGRLYVQIGKGTFISDEAIDQQLETLTSFTEDMANRGQETYSRVLRAEVLPVEVETARNLQIPLGVDIVLLRRVRMANQRPIALETSAVIASLCPDILENHNFANESLYYVLRTEYGVTMTHAEQVFEARAATQQEAKYLKLEAGAPVLATSRITFSDQNKPIEFVQSVYRGDKYKFRAILRRI